MQENYSVKSINVIRIKMIHRCIGYTLFIAAKFLVTTGWYGTGNFVIFYVIIGWESIWLFVIIARKVITFPKLEKTIARN